MFALLFLLYAWMAFSIYKGHYTSSITVFFVSYLVCIVWLIHHITSALNLSF